MTEQKQEFSSTDTLFVDELRVLFAEKLLKELDLDAAFTKAVWVAFKRGIEIGRKENEANKSS